MRKIIFILCSLLTSCTGSTMKTIEGDVFVKRIDVGSLYGASNAILENFKRNVLDSLDDEVLEAYYKSLIKNDLLDKPYFKLKLKDGNIINVFTNEDQYTLIKNDLKTLDVDHEIIHVKFRGILKEKGIYYTENILTFKKEEGQTDWKK